MSDNQIEIFISKAMQILAKWNLHKDFKEMNSDIPNCLINYMYFLSDSDFFDLLVGLGRHL